MAQLTRSYDGLAKVRQTLADFRAREGGIKNHPELSAHGKDLASQKLQAEIAAYRSKVWYDLDLELRLLRGDASKVDHLKELADKAEGARWDSGRLVYLGMVVQSAIKKAPSPDAALALYNKALQSSDPHVLRAWAEVFPGLVHEKFADAYTGEVAELERRAAIDLEGLTTTPEQLEAKAYGKEIANRALEFADVAEMAGAFYGADAFGGNEFTRLGANVSVSTSYNPQNAGREFTKSVSIADATPAGEGVAAGVG